MQLKARGTLAIDALECLSAKVRVTIKIAYGFRTYEHAEIALYRRMGKLSEPQRLTHRFS